MDYVWIIGVSEISISMLGFLNSILYVVIITSILVSSINDLRYVWGIFNVSIANGEGWDFIDFDKAYFYYSFADLFYKQFIRLFNLWEQWCMGKE